MNEIAKIEPHASSWTDEQIDLIKKMIAKDATNDELQLFLYQAKRVGLDPLARQIFAVKRWDSSQNKMALSIQTAIDGFRLIAERSGKYAGQVGPQWCGIDGIWRDAWVSDGAPVCARVGALRKDFKEPCWGVARIQSYMQRKKDGTPTRAWETMPDLMLAKCAEALALRKAFPQELSGVYTNDEMRSTSIEIDSNSDIGDHEQVYQDPSPEVPSDTAGDSKPTPSVPELPAGLSQPATMYAGQLAETAMKGGMSELSAMWAKLHPRYQKELAPWKAAWKDMAQAVDAKKGRKSETLL